MPLSVQSRRVGDVTVMTCRGRIVEGSESSALQQHVGVPSHDPCMVLNFCDVDFIDSSGLGLLVRVLTRCRAAGGDLKLCALPDRISEVLKITRLQTLFQIHASEADAVHAFYEPGASMRAPGRLGTEILSVGRSADVQAYVRELLGHAGYGVMTVSSLSDAITLVKATRPKLVVLASDVCHGGDTRAVATLRSIDATLSTIELEGNFSGHDAGEAAERLLDRIRTTLGDRGAPSSAQA